jgi:hypothetical protein
MADNVDISLKLGTEADISSAINAGARAGAAFAAAAQSAVKGISLAGSVHASSSVVAGTKNPSALAKEIKSLGFTNGLIAQMAADKILKNANNIPQPKLRISKKQDQSFWPQTQLPNGAQADNIPLSGWTARYVGGSQEDNQISKTPNFYETIQKSVVDINKTTKKEEGFLAAIKKDWTSSSWSGSYADIKPGIAAAKVAQMALAPAAEYATSYYAAGFRASTARSAKGFMQEQLEKDIALRQMQSEYGMIAFAAAGAAFGSLFGPLGTVIGGAVGGIAGLINKTIKDIENEKEKQELEQQWKTGTEVNRREGLRSLFGGSYSPGYAKAFEELGFGGSEAQVRAMSENALTFRGRQAFGQVGLHEYTMMAQVPNYFAAVNNGVTDPQVLHSLLQHDLNNIGDHQMAAYIASQLPGIGLGTYATTNSPYYGQTFNRLHSRILRGEDRRVAGISAGYLNKNARNVILTQAEMAAEMEMDAYTAPASMYAGFKPTREQYEQAQRDKDVIKQSVMRGDTAYAGSNYVINVIVDGEVVKTENIRERDFVMGGMSYSVGGN